MSTRCSAKRTQFLLVIGIALFSAAAHAQFPAQLDLANLNGTNGVVLNGDAPADHAGWSVGAAGDLNGDGIDDLVVGAPDADPHGAYSGVVYVVFGSDQGFPVSLELSALNGSNGFAIHGEALFDGAGFSVDAAGDVNGDNIGDLVIGAPDASAGDPFSGSTYVVFGTDQGFPNPLELSALDGSDGFVLVGEAEDDSSGMSVSGAGDFNGDGIDDIIIGAPFADPAAGSGAGISYVVFGSNQAWSASIDLSSLNGTTGVAFDGVQEGDLSGFAVSRAGDVNDDGIDDILIGAPIAGGEGANAGMAYVVFGSNQAWSGTFDLSTLNGGNGFAISGVAVGDELGAAVGAAGDIDGDTVDDIVLGAPKADPNGADSGAGYVVFGSDQAWPATVNLSGLDGSDGFAVNGASAGDQAGTAVGAAGKLNDDALDDMAIGAPLADPGSGEAGESYVVFGSLQVWPGAVELSALNGTNGFTLEGVAADDRAGYSVGGAGDVNADGRDDLVIGAPGDRLQDSDGVAYLVFGDTGAVSDIIFANGFE